MNDAHVGEVALQGAACDQGARHGMVGDHCLSARHSEHGLQGFDVAPEVVVKFLLRQVQEGLHAPSRVVVVDVDRQEVPDLGPVERAVPGVGRLLLAQILYAPRIRRRALVDEIVGEWVRLLAEQMQVVPLAHECATQALDVDVTPRAGEHVPVGHDDLHGAPSGPCRVCISKLA